MKYPKNFKYKKILKYTLFLITGLIGLYFMMIIGIVWEYSNKSFSAAFTCSKEKCGNPPLTPFFLKFVADYKYNNKKSIEDIGVPPILWIIGFADIMSNDEIIEMIDHFIKMGFDINQVKEGISYLTALKGAILTFNFELVKALVERGAFIQNADQNLDVLLFALKLKGSHQANPNLTSQEHQKLEEIILFLKEREKK